jgi:hypothetical protein
MMNKIKEEAMKRGMKLMTNPKVMKMMADPRFMNALSKGFQMRGQIQGSVDSALKNVATRLQLATKDDLTNLQRTVQRMENKVSTLQEKAAE